MWVDIAGSKFNTDAIAVVRPINNDDDDDNDDDGDDEQDQCVIFTTGQSSLDAGFLIDLPIDEVFAILQNAKMIELAELMIGESESNSDMEPEPEPDND